MTLENIYYIGQTLAVMAILASLIFVGFQVRQNARHTRAQIQSARVDRLMAQAIGFSDADKCAAYIRGNGGEPTPDAIKDRQFYLQCVAQLGVMIDVFSQHRDGLLSDEQYAGVTETYRRWLREPGFRSAAIEFVGFTRHRMPNFAVFIGELMPQEAPAP